MRDRERERARVRAYVRACVRVCCLSLHRLENRRCISLAPAQQQPTPSDTYRIRWAERVHSLAPQLAEDKSTGGRLSRMSWPVAILAIKRQDQSRDIYAIACTLSVLCMPSWPSNGSIRAGTSWLAPASSCNDSRLVRQRECENGEFAGSSNTRVTPRRCSMLNQCKFTVYSIPAALAILVC